MVNLWQEGTKCETQYLALLMTCIGEGIMMDFKTYHAYYIMTKNSFSKNS